MEIKTKYDIGDIVWLTKIGQLQQGPVKSKIFEIRIDNFGNISYKTCDDHIFYEERYLHDNEEDAILAQAKELVICQQQVVESSRDTLRYYERLVQEKQAELEAEEKMLSFYREVTNTSKHCGSCVHFALNACVYSHPITVVSDASSCTIYKAKEDCP